MYSETNWLAVIVAAIASQALGFIWYNPKVFGTIWMKGAGMTMEDTKKGNMPMIFGLTFVMAIVVAWYFSRFVHPDENLSQFVHGAFHGLLPALCVAAPWIITHSLYEMKKFSYVLVNVGYAVVASCLITAILFIWPVAENIATN